MNKETAYFSSTTGKARAGGALNFTKPLESNPYTMLQEALLGFLRTSQKIHTVTGRPEGRGRSAFFPYHWFPLFKSVWVFSVGYPCGDLVFITINKGRLRQTKD